MRKFLRILPATILLIACLLGVIPTYAESDELNYGIGNSTDRVIRADELFGLLFPEQRELTEAECNYLDGLFSLSYNDSIDKNLVDSEYDGDQGILTVTAAEYAYLAVNGETVKWIPQAVSLDGGEEQPFVLEDGVYKARFPELWHSGMCVLEVRYTWETEVDEEIADRMLTVCYDTAKDTLQEILAWESYQEQKTAYEAWRNYAVKKQAYDKYTALLQEYLPKKQAYDAYCAALNDYNARVAAYEAIKDEKAAYDAQVTAWYRYEQSRVINAKLYEAYKTYQFYLGEINKRLNILDTMFVRESHLWTFYASLIGKNVQSILDRRDELKQVVSVKWVDDANRATEALRVILGEYDTLRKAEYATELERVTVLFSFYAEHYSELQTNIQALYYNISSIFMNGTVQLRLQTDGSDKEKAKIPHLKQFIAHLYMLSACLDDNEVLNIDLQIKQVGTVRELIDEKIFLEDTVSSPAGVVVPTEEVLLGDLPEPVDEPDWSRSFPEDPRETEFPPDPVANPGAAPTPVADPGSEPEPVADPGKRSEPIIDPLCRALAEELRAGTLPKRTAEEPAQILSFSKTVSCNRSFQNLKTVTFYGVNGEVLDVRSLEYDSTVTPPIVSRAEDERAYYIFLGWVPEGSTDPADVVHFDTWHIRQHQSFQPLFREELKYYPITWKIADRIYTTQYTYGEIPKCSESTARSSDENEYVFTGWTPEIGPVSERTTYTACYTVTPRTFRVTWNLGTESVTRDCPINAFPIYDGSTERAPDDYVYTFLGWEPALSTVTRDVTYTAQYRRTPLCQDRSGKVNEVVHTDEGIYVTVENDHVDFRNAATYAKEIGKPLKIRFDGLEVELDAASLKALEQTFAAELCCIRLQTDTEEEASFRVVFRNSLGRELELSIALRMTMRLSTVNAVVYRLTDGERQEVETKRASFIGETNAVYVACPQYPLSYTGENCDLNSMVSRAYAGQEITLDGNCTFGYEILGAVLTFENGETQTVGKTFLMPAEKLEIALIVEPIVYHVTFVVDGVILREDTYGFDEEVILPEAPVKDDDGTNRYAFVGWTPYVTRTVGDDRDPVYTAVFSASPLEFAQPTGGGIGMFFRSALFWYLVITVVVLTAGIVLTVKLIRRKRRARKAEVPTEVAETTPDGDAPESIETEKEPESPEENSDGSGSDEI